MRNDLFFIFLFHANLVFSEYAYVGIHVYRIFRHRVYIDIYYGFEKTWSEVYVVGGGVLKLKYCIYEQYACMLIKGIWRRNKNTTSRLVSIC